MSDWTESANLSAICYLLFFIRPERPPYALTSDNRCISLLLNFRSAICKRSDNCSGVRALAIGAATVG